MKITLLKVAKLIRPPPPRPHEWVVLLYAYQWHLMTEERDCISPWYFGIYSQNFLTHLPCVCEKPKPTVWSSAVLITHIQRRWCCNSMGKCFIQSALNKDPQEGMCQVSQRTPYTYTCTYKHRSHTQHTDAVHSPRESCSQNMLCLHHTLLAGSLKNSPPKCHCQDQFHLSFV